MITFTVHEPPNPPADRIERGAGMVFVRDGFSWSAAIFTPIWMLVHRLWWPLVAYVAATATLEIVRQGIDFHPGWLTVASLALSLIVGLEAATLRRWQLERRGWALLGTVSGRNAEDCERRFFDMWLSTPAAPRAPGSAGEVATSRTTPSLLDALSAAQASPVPRGS